MVNLCEKFSNFVDNIVTITPNIQIIAHKLANELEINS
ncbi:hypothetical protein YE105_C3001 [Yersinia enterocolitica subsp. palearctica 105.5R(r)]|uniref:Uncharacterized protein n=2 Tax=Yersinia enterocolitica TaxID=630 RepID=A0A0H3P0C9_YERE1|nr:hypothetical protein YE105_C3001 [Yersinia enterocolitica subsp. palearctica 105.5R(r)]CBX73336.1 unknown protein [Yersinia enterocolitica W22703]CBY28219.1 hypothetical protein Y11_43111 [Yersinia enterocolitica subsp. palearctica Y11]CCO67114.1 hypothetical protein D322_218 [Yersinia enterocolitica IP 10393]